MREREVKIFFDGSSQGNPGPAGIGIVIYDDSGNKLLSISEPIGFATNNEAEYRAMLRALEEALRLRATSAQLFSDSELLVKQFKGEYSVKEPRLQKLRLKVLKLASKLKKLELNYVGREENREADKLAREAVKKSKNK